MPGRDTEYTCSMPAMRDSTCSAGRATNASTSLAAAPGKGTKTLAMVTLICGSSSRGVINVAPMPSSSAIRAIKGVREFLRKYSAMRPETPKPVPMAAPAQRAAAGAALSSMPVF
jgi:hypothetical protein